MGIAIKGRRVWGLVAVLVGCALVAGCGGGSNGSAGNSAFVSYWADSTAWCDHTSTCQVDTLAQCKSQWPSADVTERALNATGWTQEQIAQCEQSARALDRCYFGTTCAQAATYSTVCAAENTATLSDCRALNDAATAIQSGGTINTPSEFAAYYADPTIWCQHVVECNVDTLANCKDTWPTVPLVQRALDSTGWTATQIAACERASRAVDQCYVATPCDEAKNYPQGCEQEDTDFSANCQDLLDAIASPTITNPGVPSDPNTGVNVGVEFCSKVEMCQGSPLSATDRANCEYSTNQGFGVLPDPAGTTRCLNATSCSALLGDPQASVQSCISIDAQATHCIGTDLHICDTAGTCRDVSCDAACSFLSLSSLGCAFDTTYGYDKCQCG